MRGVRRKKRKESRLAEGVVGASILPLNVFRFEVLLVGVSGEAVLLLLGQGHAAGGPYSGPNRD